MKNKKAPKTTSVTCVGYDEIYCLMFTCNNCEQFPIMPRSKYCSHCGCEIDNSINKDERGEVIE